MIIKLTHIQVNTILYMNLSFDSAIKRMSKIFQRDEQYFMFTKGATEWLLPLCSSYQSEGLHIMDEDFQQTVTDQMQSHAEQGYRVLSIAYKEINASEIPEDWDTEYLREEMEKDLVYLGFVVILDPPRDGVSEAVQECKKSGNKCCDDHRRQHGDGFSDCNKFGNLYRRRKFRR